MADIASLTTTTRASCRRTSKARDDGCASGEVGGEASEEASGEACEESASSLCDAFLKRQFELSQHRIACQVLFSPGPGTVPKFLTKCRLICKLLYRRRSDRFARIGATRQDRGPRCVHIQIADYSNYGFANVRVYIGQEPEQPAFFFRMR